ncbi:MAG: VWA domain-containing protein [Halioglobus sp.]
MQSRLVSFIQVLRTHDVRISPAETLDAMNVASILGYNNRESLRDGLSMALAKTTDEKAIFTACFEEFFSRGLSDFSQTESENSSEEADKTNQENADGDDSEGDDSGNGESSGEQSLLEAAAQDSPELQSLLDSPLMQGLINNERNELSLAINRAGEQVGLSQIQMFTQKGQYTRKILDELGEEHIRQAVIELERQENPALGELQRYRDILREQVRDYVEREYLLNAAGKNQQFMDEILSKTRLNNIEHHYLHKVHELVRKMAKRLAARHSRKRKITKRGQLNMAKTIRHGIPNDGVMFKTYWKQTRKDKPKILAICDVSGSVAAYAKFLLMFLYSLQDILPQVRSFAFSSHLGEVSHLFDEYPLEKAIELVNWQYGGATDYATALEDFSQLALDDINSETTVIILGDARNNNGDPRLEVMQSIFARSRQVLWLNPESRRAWGTGDSEMLRYQSACHFAAECNNLKQLERIVDQLLRSTR